MSRVGIRVFAEIAENAFGRLDEAQFHPDLDIVHHTATTDEDLAIVFGGKFQDLVDAAHQGRKRGNDDATFGFFDDVFEVFSHLFFGHGVAGFRGVGGFSHQGEHTFGSDLG